MSNNGELIELLDSILEHSPSSFKRQSRRNAAAHGGTDPNNASFDKVRTLDLLINNVLPLFNSPNGFKLLLSPSLLVKVFKTVHFLLSQDHLILLKEDSSLHYQQIVPRMFSFLKCNVFPDNVVMQLKSLILEIIDLVANERSHLQGYQLRCHVQKWALNILNGLVNDVFETTVTDLSTVNSILVPKLSISIHFLQLLQDYKLHSALFLQLYNFQLETLVRKLWLVLNKITALSISNTYLDELCSVLLLSMFTSFHKDDIPSTFKLKFLSLKLNQLLNWNLLYAMPRLQATMANVILELVWKVGVFLLDPTLLSHLLRLNSCLIVEFYIKPTSDPPSSLDPSLVKAICLAIYVIQKLEEPEDEENESSNSADTTINLLESTHFQTIIVAQSISSFPRLDLEKLRIKLMQTVSGANNNDNSLLPLLDSNNSYLKNLSDSTSSFISLVDQMLKTPEKLTSLQLLYIINSLGTLLCVEAGDLDPEARVCSRCDMQLNDVSYINNCVSSKRPLLVDNPIVNKLLELVLAIVSGRDVDPILITSALLSLKKMFASFVPPKINSSQERLFKFLSKCLVNDIREVRIMLTKVLPYYLILDNDDVYESNFQFLISCLQQIKINQELHLAESTIIAWAELLIVIGIDEKLILVLVKLIDFIGSENQFQSTILFHQLQIISSCKRKTPWQLLSPFLPHLSVIIVKQMRSKPMIINKICGLVGVPLDVFLSRTQLYTLPHVLTYYKYDLIGEISLATKVSKYELIKRNLPKIILYLLTVEPKINELRILQILGNVNDSFKNQPLHELIGNHILTSWEVLKLYSPEFNNLERIKAALSFIASLYISNNEDASHVLKLFLNRTILGIVQNFSESTYDLKGLQPYIEKLKSIWAIECLILISGQGIVLLLPQITACLQLNLEIKHLHLETLYCLSTLTENLDQTTMFVILDFILSLILQKWDQFSVKCKKSCQKIISFVMKQNEQLFKQRYYHYFFSFSFNPELVTVYNDARTLFPSSAKSSSYNLLHDLTIRCNHDNKFVVLQLLDDLIHYFTKYQDEFHSSFVKLPTFVKYIPKLSATLLNISYKYKSLDQNVLHKCSIIYGLMGSLDFNKFYLSLDDNLQSELLVVVGLFQDQNELYRFLIQFISNTLVPLFWASIDPVKQLFLAYLIQEYLKLLNLNGIDPNTLAKNSTGYIIWNKFSRISQSTLLPLLNSKYSVNGSKDDSATYPIHKNHIKHSTWLREFTLDLLKNAKKDIGITLKAQKIFHICSFIIKDQDLAICNHILPYIALNCVLVDESVKNDVELEIMTILKSDIDTLKDSAAVESLKACYQSVFSIVDYFQKWTSSRKQKRRRQDVSASKVQEMVGAIELFLLKFPRELIARRSAQCKSYERAILNLEETYRSSTIDSREFFSTIQSMYVEIDDLDSLEGVLKTFSTQSLNDKLLQFQYSDDWKTAQDCYEALSEFDLEEQSLDNTTNLLKSLNKYNLYENCLEKLDLVVKTTDTVPLEWINLGLNSSIFTGSVHDIKKWIFEFESNLELVHLNDLKILVNYEVAKLLICLHDSNFRVAETHIENAIKLLGNSLAASKQTSLSKTRDIVSQLHWLTEAKSVISNESSLSKFQSTVKTMDTRLSNTSKDFQSNWQILTIRRVLDKLHPQDFTKHDISNVWVKLARTLRLYSRLDLSRKLIMNALVLQNSNNEVDLEYAQLLWAQDDHSRALKAIDELRSRNFDGVSRDAAKIQLIYTEWLDLSDSGSSELIIEEYTQALQLDSKWEKPYYCLGKYYNKILENQSNLDKDIKSEKDFYGDYERGLVFNYLRAIKAGHSYVFELLPKVITIWLDFSASYNEVPQAFASSEIPTKRRENYDLMRKYVKEVAASTPKVYWYTVFSQLTSRMIHPRREIQDIIVDLIARITYEYPQQLLWSVFAQSKSTMKQRSQLGATILNLVSEFDKSKTKTTLKSALLLFDSLLKVCMQEVNRKTSEMNLKDDFGFNHLVTPCDSLVVPLRENFEIKFPSNFDPYNKKFSNYPIGSKITIHRIDDRVKILASMQKPRKITIRGSDGGIYNILCKPHDDLRKDAKLMEVTTMIDKLLQKDEESELRKLSIATYAVVPLNETYGIIEWVDRCRTMREIVLTYLANSGNPIDFGYCKLKLADGLSVEEKMQNFNKIKERFPPIFRLWFLEEFPDPKAWYMARNMFTSSSAVMSIVGHILGLGDRHMDNILMMEKTGGVLHVDFDCLFDKGLTLTVPERVPFRLTSNMVDAFGISGVEGVFRRSCEVTTRLVRNNETALMNILESFLYDPILDWSTSKRRRKEANHNPEVVLNNIKKKIRGIEKDTSLSLSVPANVDLLITQATSLENLLQMYIGWMSFL